MYFDEPNNIYGALYHLVATYYVIIGSDTDWLMEATDRASPKSANFARQSESNKMFEGLRSLWINYPECIYLIPFNTWYITYFLWTFYIIFALTTAWRSVSMKSNTK